MLVRFTDKIAVNADKIAIVRMAKDTDQYARPHVIIDLGVAFLELPPELTMNKVCDLIDATLKGEQ